MTDTGTLDRQETQYVTDAELIRRMGVRRFIFCGHSYIVEIIEASLIVDFAAAGERGRIRPCLA